MKLSSRGSGLEGGPVSQHRPEDVHPPPRQGDHGLGVPLAFAPLAVVEGPRLGYGPHAGEGGLVEDPLEDPVAAPTLAVVAHPLAGVAGGGHEPRVGRQAVGAQDRAHPGEAGEDASLGAGKEAPAELLVERIHAFLEDQDAPGELGSDLRGDALRGQLRALALGRFDGLLREGFRFDYAALLEVGGDPPAPRPADRAGAVVTGDQFSSGPRVVRLSARSSAGKRATSVSLSRVTARVRSATRRSHLRASRSCSPARASSPGSSRPRSARILAWSAMTRASFRSVLDSPR